MKAIVMLAAGYTALAALTPGRAAPVTWKLATGDTILWLEVRDNCPVIVSLKSTGSSHDWAKTGLVVPLMSHVWVDGREQATSWRFEGAKRIRATGATTLTFVNDEPGMVLRSIWRARPGHGPVEHSIEIENVSGRRITVSNQDSLSLVGMDSGGAAKVWWVRRGAANAVTDGGVGVEDLNAGLDIRLDSNVEDTKSPVPWASVQVGEQRGIYVGWEFSGLGRVHVKGNTTPNTVDICVGNHTEFKTDVEPGETFLVPPAFVGCYDGDIDEGSYTLHRFVIEKLRPRIPNGYPDPSVNCAVYPDGGGPNATDDGLLRVAKFFHEVGVETFMVDAIWYSSVGDWRFDPKRFPKGSIPLETYVHGAGMKWGLWCAWTNGGISEDPNAVSILGERAHPDWFRDDVPADWKPRQFAGAQICLGCKDAREWLETRVPQIVSNYKLDYLKHDIGPIVCKCPRLDHRHHYGVDVSYWSAMGYYEVQEKLLKGYPNLVLENCSGAGHIKDFGVVSRTHYTATTDTLSNLPDRTSFYDSTYVLPPLVLQAYTFERFYPVKGDDPGPYLWRSGMMGAWQIAPVDSASWSAAEKESARRAVEIYKEWIRPILGDCKVHHVLPRPDGVNWDGLFYFSPSLRKGTLYVFRPESKEQSKTVRLKGLDASKEYWVWSEDGSVPAGKLTGEELMHGLKISLPSEYTSDLVYLQDVAIGKPKGTVAPGSYSHHRAD